MTALRGVTSNVCVPDSPHVLEDSTAGVVGVRVPSASNLDEPALHRISEVRQEQGVSLRSAARRMGTNVSMLKSQEQPGTDLRLSELYQWQQALDVPVGDLLVEQQESLSRPVMQRAQMVRLMKTAAAMLEQSNAPAMDCMARTLVQQLVEMMPELAQVSPWHSMGQRRGQDDYGRAFDRRISDEMLQDC